MKQIEQQNKRVSPSPQKGAITERGLFRLMLPSLLGILLCSTCLAGLTWACFSDSVTSSAYTITAATFTVEVTITEITEEIPTNEGDTPEEDSESDAAANSPSMVSETDTTVNRNVDGSYSLTAGKIYTVTLTASGTTKGYCKVTVNETVYYTETMDPAMNPAQELVFYIDCSSMTTVTTVTITPGWVNSDYSNIKSEAALNKIISDETTVTQKTVANTTEQADPPAVEEPSADTDETLRGETGETARTVPGESSKTTGESTDRDEEPANEGTDTEKANSEPSADEPTAPPSEGQSEE